MADLDGYLAAKFGNRLSRPAQVTVWVGHPKSLRVALQWAIKRLGVEKTNIHRVEPDGETIKIGQVRPLYHQAHLSRADSDERRAIIIEQAYRLSLPAQNALLKLLEEPPEGVYFLLGVEDLSDITPTITSRAEVINLTPVSNTEFNSLFKNEFTIEQMSRRFHLSGGDPLLAQSIDELSAIMDQAKQFLTQPLGEAVSSLQKQNPKRHEVQTWIEQLALLCRAGLNKAGSPTEVRAWLNRAQAVLLAQQRLSANVNHKLAMNWLLLGLRQ